MNHRERIRAAVHHQPVDRCPTDIWAVNEVWDGLRQHFGVAEKLAVYDCLGIDGIIEIAAPYIGPELPRTPDDWVNEWGMGYRRQHVAGGTYDEQVFFPLAPAETIADLEAYAWLSTDWYDYQRLPELAAQAAINAAGVGGAQVVPRELLDAAHTRAADTAAREALRDTWLALNRHAPVSSGCL